MNHQINKDERIKIKQIMQKEKCQSNSANWENNLLLISRSKEDSGYLFLEPKGSSSLAGSCCCIKQFVKELVIPQGREA